MRIDRRADDPQDPRRNQPNTKTAARLLPLSEELAQLTHRYIARHRRSIVGARRHSFLFVAGDNGAPMALATLNKLFVVLRGKCPGLPTTLTAHRLRHSWNDRFSGLMDESRVGEETETKWRSRLMGWSETSKTAAIYTRRHIQRKAHRAALDLQRKFNKEQGHDS